MGNFMNYLARSRIATCFAWFMLFLPALVNTFFIEPYFLPVFYFLCVVVYLRKVRNYIALPAIVYTTFMVVPPFFYFIRWFIIFARGGVSFHEYITQEHYLLHLKFVNFKPQGIVFIVLMVLSIYIINLRKRLASDKSGVQ